MSQSRRASRCAQWTGVNLAGSGMAAMSGLWGPWPISPAAKPANPAPSSNRASRWRAGTSLPDGLPHMSTNWASRNSMSRSLISRRTSSSVWGRSSMVVLSGCPAGEPQLDDLDGDAEREPVLLLEVEVAQPLDATEPLPQGVGMGVQQPGRPHDVAPALEVHLQGPQQFAAPTGVVVDQLLEPFLLAVAHGVDGAEDVAVGAEVLVGPHPRRPLDQASDLGRRGRLLQPPGERGRPPAGVRQAP